MTEKNLPSARTLAARRQRAANPDVYRAASRRYRETNLEKERERQREAKRKRRTENGSGPDRLENAKSYKKHAEKRKAESRAYRKTNDWKIREREERHEVAVNRAFHRIKWSAKARDLKMELSEKEVADLARPMVCEVTGLALNWKACSPFKASFDRIDNSVGYIPGNVRLVCWIFNRAKNSDADEDVLVFAKAMVARA